MTQEISMTTSRAILAAAFTLASIGATHADGLRPIQGRSIDLGELSGIVYYTVEPDGFWVVATLAEGEVGTPVRIKAVLSTGQSIVLSTARAHNTVAVTN
jgi:hypothetical protein